MYIFFEETLLKILRTQERINERLDTMATTLDDLKAEIAAETINFTKMLVALADASKTMVTDIEELLARPGVDYTDELTQLKANAAAIATGIAAVQAVAKTEDGKVNPPGPSDFTAPAGPQS